MIRRKKKGFTIVELVIVIAVIGILAAILIPTFVSLNDKANKAADDSLVHNLNTAMSIEEGEGKKNSTYNDAIEYLDNYGYRLANLATKAGHDLLWNSKTNRFLLNEDSAYAEDKLNTGAEDVDYWTIKDSIPAVNKFSIYAGLGWNDANPVTLNGIGFDAGKHSLSSISYGNTTGSAQDVTIRTNSVKTEVEINAANDTVKHYGVAGSVNVKAVASNSYHEHGKVPFIQAANGRIALEKDSEVAQIHLTKTGDNFNNITIAKDASVEMPDFSRDDVVIPEGGKLVVALQEGTSDPEAVKDFVWLTKQGIYEQVTISTSSSAAGTTYADQVSSEEKQDAAKQIANNIGATATVGETVYNVSVNENRDIVLTDTTTGNTAYTLETQTNGSTVLKDGNGDAVDSSVATVSSVVEETVTDTGIAGADFEDYKADKVDEGAIDLGIDEYEYWIDIHSDSFAGGDGTAAHPYQISNGRELALLAYYMNNSATRAEYQNKYYELTANIDLSGKCWTPISNMNRKEDKDKLFGGVFDGHGYTINGLTTNGLRLYADISLYVNDTTPWNSDGEYSYGLFGTVYGATLENINFTKVSIKVGNGDVSSDDKRYVGDSVGTLAGAVRGTSIIRNIDVKSGTIEGYDATGGVVGRLESRSGDTCSFTLESINNSANVTAIRRAGGLIGYSGGYYFEKTGEGENEVLKIKGSGYAEWASFKKCTNTGKIISLGIDSDFEEGGWGYYGAAALCCVCSDAADTNNDSIGELSELASRYNALGITKAFINSGSTKNTVNGTEYNNTYIIMNNLHELD